jgi:dipeptide/tripeptide permease
VSSPDTEQSQRTFFGHPPVLANLFGVELWERFSFYGMQGILLIYLYYTADRGGLGIDEGTADSSTSPRFSAPGWPTACSVPNAPCSTPRSW